MKQEDLNKLKLKLSFLDDDEKLKRDLYLKDLSSGKLQGPPTGYPSIDKPQLQHFDIVKMHTIKNDKTIYEAVWHDNKDELDDIALEFFYAKITYKEFFEKIEDTAKALKRVGVKKGDFVTICCAGIPEAIYAIYALAKMGAVANLMAPYFDKDQMSDRINDCKSDVLIVMDKFYEHIESAIDKTNIKTRIVVPTLNSSPLRLIPKAKKKFDNQDVIMWNKFIKNAKDDEAVETFKYEPNYPLCMVYSSGTTGASKAILLSHDSFQNSVLSYESNKFDIVKNTKLYAVIPIWFSTGINALVHNGVKHHITVFLDPRFERNVFVKNIIKHNINYVIAPTSMFEGFLDSKNVKNKKLKHLENPFEGGEPLPAYVKLQIEEVWKSMGCNSVLTAGYGQCECGATVTTPSQYIFHHLGSVALPLPGVTIGIFDDNNNELQYGQRGNIYVDTPCGMMEYFNNPKATEEYFYMDGYGHKWSKTGDIGYILPNGDLFVEGRKSDYTIVNGKHIYNFDVEKPIIELQDIQNCDCVSCNLNGKEELALHIIFRDAYKEKYSSDENLKERLVELQKIIYNEHLDLEMVPEYFKVRESFPHKPSGKRDVEALKSETDSFIYLNREEIKDFVRKRK